MHIAPIILVGLAMLAYSYAHSSRRIKPARFPHLRGWQKLFGVLALVAAMLMVINPEFLALGLLGDTAFFDLFVLLLSVQLQMASTRVWQHVHAALVRVLRGMIPRLRLSCFMFIMIFAPITDMVEAIQKAAHRIST